MSLDLCFCSVGGNGVRRICVQRMRCHQIAYAHSYCAAIGDARLQARGKTIMLRHSARADACRATTSDSRSPI